MLELLPVLYLLKDIVKNIKEEVKKVEGSDSLIIPVYRTIFKSRKLVRVPVLLLFTIETFVSSH